MAFAVGDSNCSSVVLSAIGFLFVNEPIILFLAHLLLDFKAAEQGILFKAYAGNVLRGPINLYLVFLTFFTGPG